MNPSSAAVASPWIRELQARARKYDPFISRRANRQREDAAGEVMIATGDAWESPGDTQVRVGTLYGEQLFHRIDHDARFTAVAMAPTGDRAWVARCEKDRDTSQPPPGKCWEILEIPAQSGPDQRAKGPRTIAEMYPLQSMDAAPDGRTLDVASGRTLVRLAINDASPSETERIALPERITYVDHLRDGTVVMCPESVGYPHRVYVLRPGEDAVRRVGFRALRPDVWTENMAPYDRCIDPQRREATLLQSPFIDEDGLICADVPRSAVFSPDASAMAAVHKGDLVVYDAPREPAKVVRAAITNGSDGAAPAIWWTPDGTHLVSWVREKGDAPTHTATIVSRDGASALTLPSVGSPTLEGDTLTFTADGARQRLQIPQDLAAVEQQPWYVSHALRRLFGRATVSGSPPPQPIGGVVREADHVVVGGVRIPRRV